MDYSYILGFANAKTDNRKMLLLIEELIIDLRLDSLSFWLFVIQDLIIEKKLLLNQELKLKVKVKHDITCLLSAPNAVADNR